MEKKWNSLAGKKPYPNKIVELKAEITFHARYQPYSLKQEWKALDDGIEEMDIIGWRNIYGDM